MILLLDRLAFTPILLPSAPPVYVRAAIVEVDLCHAVDVARLRRTSHNPLFGVAPPGGASLELTPHSPTSLASPSSTIEEDEESRAVDES